MDLKMASRIRTFSSPPVCFVMLLKQVELGIAKGRAIEAM